MDKYKLTLRFSEDDRPNMLDITSLFYDFELLHDLSVLLVEEDYLNFRYSQTFWYRNGRPLNDAHRLKATRIVKESPLIWEVVLSSLGGFWVMLQIIDKIESWPLKREKLELDVKKLRREEAENERRVMDLHADRLDQYISDMGAEEISDKITKRLSQNPISLEKLEIERDEQDN